MGRDANNQMFPMDWAVINIENGDNWSRFIHHLSQDFNLAIGAYLRSFQMGIR
jgi:hypothetical protein